MDSRTIAVVIPIYNRLEVTKKGLQYISDSVENYYLTYGSNTSIKIIVVDDGSTDGSSEWIEANYPGLTVLRGDGNLWWTGAVNLGIQYALTSYKNISGVILQNDDVIVDRSWIADLLDATTAHPNSLIGCATSTLDKKGQITYGGRELHPWFAKERMLNQGMQKDEFPKGYVASSFDLYGRGLYVPVEVFQAIGLFNQAQFKHRGDMDIPLRAKKAGFNLLVSYDALVYEFPEHAFGLDSQQKLTFKDAYKALTDFRSSNNIRFIYYYSLQATRNPLQFGVFFCSNLFYNLRRICWRVVNQHI